MWNWVNYSLTLNCGNGTSLFFKVMIPLPHFLVNECQLIRSNQAKHLEKYIIAVSLLNGKRILPNDIEVAKGLLHEFVSQLDNFYEVDT